MTHLLEGLTLRVQVIHALILRETRTRYGRYRLGYVWALLDPLLFVGMFSAVFYLFDRRLPYGMDAVSFIATGIIPYQLFTTTTGQAVQAINANRGLLFYSQVQPLDLVAARVLLEFATTAVVFVIIMGSSVLLGITRAELHNPLMLMEGFVLGAALGGSVGLVFCGLAVLVPSVEKIYPPILRPLFWISGIFFAAEELPSQFLNVLMYNPLLHVIELIRAGWFASYRGDYADAGYVAAFIFVLLFFGLTLERVARRHLELG